MSRPHCIVCGKQIRKRFESISFLPVQGNRQNYDRKEGNIYLDHEHRPKTKEECQRFTNHAIISVSVDHTGERIFSFKWWEGEYEDEFFCSGKCAQKQGYASARAGHRWTWTRRD